jgi:hypothetical protein
VADCRRPWCGAVAALILALGVIQRATSGEKMAKKKRKKATAKAAKRTKALATKALAKKKTAKKKITGKKIAVAKKRPKTKAATQTKSSAKKPATKAPARSGPGTKAGAPPETLSHKIAGAVSAVVDIFTSAERLHHKLEPDISNEPE